MSAVLQQIQPSNQTGAIAFGTGGNEGGPDGEGGGGGEGGRSRLPIMKGGAPFNNPMLVFQGQVQNFLGGGGNVEVFFDNGTGVPRRLPGNIGDHFRARGRSAHPRKMSSFRGMVQDMFDPEYYMGIYKDGDVGRTTKFSDATDLPEKPNRWETQTLERCLLYYVPSRLLACDGLQVPGENDWVKQAFLSPSLRLTTGDNSGAAAPPTNHSGKRTRETDDSNDVEMDWHLNVESVDSKRLVRFYLRYIANKESFIGTLEVRRIQSSEKYMDRVNMYASFYVGIRNFETSLRGSNISTDESGKGQTNMRLSPDSVLSRVSSDKSL